MRISTIALSAGSLLLIAQLVSAQTAPGADTRGRYEGVAGSANAVWVVDTHTGKVRKCTQEFADRAPDCSAYSN